jgi:hypothetical protein
MVEINDEEYKQFLEFKNKKKEYYKTYYQNEIKAQSKYCPCCDKTVKLNSYYNHIHSVKHLKNFNEKYNFNIE